MCRAVSPVSLAAGHLEVRLFLPVLTRTRGSVHKIWQMQGYAVYVQYLMTRCYTENANDPYARLFTYLQALFLFFLYLFTPWLILLFRLIGCQGVGNSDTCQVSCNPKQIIPHPLHHFPSKLNVPIEQRFHVPRVTLVPLEHVTCKGGTPLNRQLHEGDPHNNSQ